MFGCHSALPVQDQGRQKTSGTVPDAHLTAGQRRSAAAAIKCYQDVTIILHFRMVVNMIILKCV